MILLVLWVGFTFWSLFNISRVMEFAQWLVNWTAFASYIAFALCVVVFLPLGLLRRARGIAGHALFISSYLFGVTLWLVCVLATYATLGMIWMLVGVFLGGVGIVPLAFINFIVRGVMTGDWGVLGVLTQWLACCAASRILGLWLMYKHSQFMESRSMAQSVSSGLV